MESFDLMNILVSPQVVALSAGLVAILAAAGRTPIKGKLLRDLPAWRKALPVVVLAAGVAGAFIPGIVTGSAVHKLIVGIVAGMTASHGRKTVKRLFVDKLDKAKPCAK